MLNDILIRIPLSNKTINCVDILDMPQTNFEEFQELVEQFEQEMSLKAICEQEGVSYRSYIA